MFNQKQKLMKKISLLLTACAFSLATFAQDGDAMTSKNGHVILPEEGDIALGFDAVPVIDFALNSVNIMNNTGQTAQHPGYVSGFNQILVGKYFIADDMAVRARLGINTNTMSSKDYGDDPLADDPADAENILLQTSTMRNSNYFLSGGIEMRRGHNRLQGYYGGELILGFGGSRTSNDFEIAYDEDAEEAGYMGFGSSRTLEQKSGTSITFGLRGFIGIEYFIAPKISIGAEYGWGFGLTTTPRGESTVENWGIEPGDDATDPYQWIDESEGGQSSSSRGFSVDNGISQALGGTASLTIHFHF